MTSWRAIAASLVLTIAAAFLGTWVGARFVASPQPRTSLHEMVHDELELTAEQHRQLDKIEKDFAVRRRQLEAEIRSANRELAVAIQTEGQIGPEVTRAVDHFHHAMGRLQKLTIEHVFAMRRVLTPEQAAKFDRTIVKALTDEAR